MTELELIRDTCASCTACKLAETRRHIVFGEGDPDARLMIVGEGPGEEEDRTGRPFVGRAGQLLDQILNAAGISREEIYIANMVKCRPPGNRNPQPDEIAACDHWLLDQIRFIKPQIIITLGNVPTQYLLETQLGITRTRGTWGVFKKLGHPIPVMPIFHPAYLLRNPVRTKGGPKWLTWQDIQAVKQRLNELEPKSVVSLGPVQESLFQ